MSIMSVNSYYDNAVNGLFITAGMLQRPFFSTQYDMARNFGGVGAIMGHELTHGFDNTGRKYDQESRLRDWYLHTHTCARTRSHTQTHTHTHTASFDAFSFLGGTRTQWPNTNSARNA